MLPLLNTLQLGAKLWLAPVCALLALLAMAAASHHALRTQQQRLEDLAGRQTQQLLALVEHEQLAEQLHGGAYQLIAWHQADYAADKTEALARGLRERLQRLKGGHAKADAAPAAAALAPPTTAFATAIQGVLDMAEADPAVASTMMIQSEAPFQALSQGIGQARQAQATAMSEALQAAQAEQRRLASLGLVLTLGCLAVVAWLTWRVRASIVESVGRIRDVAQQLNDGDLTQQVRVDGCDEVAVTARAMGDTVERMRHSIGSVHQAVDQLDRAIHEIASGNQDLSERTERQASRLQHTAAGMARLAEAVSANTTRSREAAGLAVKASTMSARGGEMVQQVVAVMEGITASSQRVHDIIDVINGIAFQTNILALNAAVEAARAGEHGRGFAVVAAEVRTLAQRCAAAADEIKSHIAASNTRVGEGGALVGSTGAAIAEVVDEVHRLRDLIDLIARANGEQDGSVHEVSHMLGELDAVTQQNAALVEQAAAVAASMRQESERLVRSFQHFRVEPAAH